MSEAEIKRQKVQNLISHQHKFCELAREGFSEMATSRKIWADAENVFSTKLQKPLREFSAKPSLASIL